MESRFRRLVGQRRDKTGLHTQELETHPVPCQPASAQPSQLIIISRPSERSACKVQKPENDVSLLKSLSYDSVVPGKAPVFVNKPQKGNGPIKLQTSRRLSSGELLATSQDSRRTIADIREGDYIIGRKQGRDLQTRFSKTSTPSSEGSTSSARYTITGGTGTLHVNHVTTQASRSSPQSPLVTIHSFETNGTPIQAADWSKGPTVSLSWLPRTKNDSYEIRNDGLIGLDRVSTVEPGPVQSATISALWKAESDRLVKISGQDGFQPHMAHLNSQPRMQRRSRSSTRVSSKPPSIMLESLSQPAYERKSMESRRSSVTSGRWSSYRDDISDTSSFTGASMASSFLASSSHTTQTSFGDFDPPSTREDIRQIVQEMRSTYLRALETQPPTSHKPKSIKKKRRPKVTKASSFTRCSNMQPSDGDASAFGPYPDDCDRPRATSHPVESFGGLPAVESATVGNGSAQRPELLRADSLTLGNLVTNIVLRQAELPSEPASPPKQDEMPSALQPQALCTSNTTHHSGDLINLKHSEEAVVPATLQKQKHVSLEPSHCSAGLAAQHNGSVPLPSMNMPVRPPPLPISQISLVNCI